MNYLNKKFENLMSAQCEWPQAIEKNIDGGYKLAQTAAAWEVWQAAVEAAVEEVLK